MSERDNKETKRKRNIIFSLKIVWFIVEVRENFNLGVIDGGFNVMLVVYVLILMICDIFYFLRI